MQIQNEDVIPDIFECYVRHPVTNKLNPLSCCYVPKNVCLIHDSHSLFHRKMYIRLLFRCHLCSIWPPVFPLDLTYFFNITFETLMREPILCWLLTFNVQNLYLKSFVAKDILLNIRPFHALTGSKYNTLTKRSVRNKKRDNRNSFRQWSHRITQL
jgi:hypothetical protein